MAKKQKRSPKNKAGEKSESGRQNSPVKNREKDPSDTAPLTQRQFVTLIVAAVGLVVYVAIFLFTKTEFGDRFWTYLVLLLNQDIYLAYWTGSPGGSFHLFDRWPIFAGLVFHLALSIGLGTFVLNKSSWQSNSNLEQFVMSTGLGLGMISTYVVAVGLMQILALKHWLVIPVLVFSIFGWRHLLVNNETDSPKPSIESAEPNWTRWVWLLSLPFFVLVILASMIPPWEFDVREYHLQVPKEWFQQGGVGFLSHNVYGNMPLGTEMHALFAMLYTFGDSDWWWGVLVGKTISGFFVVLNAAAIFCIGSRLSSQFAGMAGAVIYVSTPWVIANGIIGYNEGAISFYLLLSILVLVEFVGRPETDSNEDLNPNTTSIAILLGLAVGSAMACKYTAIPFVAIPAFGIFVICLYKQSDKRSLLAGILWVCVAAACISGIWFAKNLILVGNPTYPLLESVFDTARTPLQADQWAKAHSPDSLIPPLSDLFSILHSLLFSFKWLSPLTVPFAVLAVAGGQRKTAMWFAGYLIFVFAIWLCLTHRLERFLLPFYSVVCVLAGLGADWLPKRNWKTLASVVLILGCGLNFLFASSRLVGDVRVFASLKDLDFRRLSAKDYMHPDDQIIPLSHLSPTIAWLNKNHKDGRVLFFGECRPLSAEFDVIYNTCFDRCETWLRFANRTPSEFHRLLHAEGITHVLINIPELKRFQSTYGYNVEDEGKPVNPEDLIRLEGSVFTGISPFGKLSNPAIILLEVIPK